MRAKILGLFGVASALLVAQAASSETADERWRLMEQRMAEMEDRLVATTTKLEAAETKLEERDATLVEHGLLASEDDGLRSSVGTFFEAVDISGVAAASYNHRLISDKTTTGGNPLFKNPNANTFQLDQIWMILDKAPTEESRGGFHAEFITGTSTAAQGARNGNPDVPYLYSGYVSYLAPVGNGIQVDLGKLATVLGAEVVQTDGNFFITQGAVFGLQPVTYNGISIGTSITDELGFVAGVVNDVYSDTDISIDNDKAYFGQFSYSGDLFGLNVGGIIGDADASSCTTTTGQSTDCQVSIVDVVFTMDPTDNVSLWANYDWVHSSGRDLAGHGDAHGISGAGRIGITDTFGIASRVEYIWTEDTLTGSADDGELLTVTGTLDKTLVEGLVGRLEFRWDKLLTSNGGGFSPKGDLGTNLEKDSLVVLAQMYYQF